MTTTYVTEANSIPFSLVTKTVADIVLYVGYGFSNDTNSGLSTFDALATIQEAIRRIPDFGEGHLIQIDINEGSYAGFTLNNKFHPKYTKLLITGALGAPSIDGKTTGTATGGSTTQVVDAAGGWTPDQLNGMFVRVDGEIRVIYDNDGTTLELAGAFSATASGKVYEILEAKTIIDSIPTDPTWEGWAMIEIYGSSACTISNLKIDCAAQSYDGFDVVRTTGIIVIDTVQILDPYWGVYMWGGLSVVLLNGYINGAFAYGIYAGLMINPQCGNNYICNCGEEGINVVYSTGVLISGAIQNCGGEGGVYSWAINGLDFDTPLIISDNTTNGIVMHFSTGDMDNATISNNGEYGIKIGNLDTGNRSGHSHLNAVGTITISDNGDSGVHVGNNSAIMVSAMTGSGNTGYGIEAEMGSSVAITSDTAVTGTSGNATINEGNTVLVWATDFSTDRDKVINLDNSCRIERID